MLRGEMAMPGWRAIDHRWRRQSTAQAESCMIDVGHTGQCRTMREAVVQHKAPAPILDNAAGTFGARPGARVATDVIAAPVAGPAISMVASTTRSRALVPGLEKVDAR